MADRFRPRAQPSPSSAARVDPAELAAAISSARQGDEQAFRSVYRIVQPRLLPYVRALVGETDAEDVAAEAWMGIAKDLATFRGDAAGFLAWSATVARNRAMDHLRRRRPVFPLPHELLPQRATGASTADLAEERIGTEAALDMIRALPHEQAQAILLRVIMGLDTAATARVLGKRPGAVRTSAYRGLRTLTSRLQPDAEPPPPPSARQIRQAEVRAAPPESAARPRPGPLCAG